MLFEPAQIQAKRDRAARRTRAGTDAFFIHLEAAGIIAERLAVTRREFKQAALLHDGPQAASICSLLIESVPNLSNLVPLPFPRDAPGPDDPQEERYDLVISIFDLHWMNDLPGVFSRIGRSLKPDGLFSFALPGSGSLAELRSAIMAGELAEHGGAAMRVDPFPEVRQIGDLLQRTGFRLPVADLESRKLSYRTSGRLIADLRDNGAACSLAGRPLLSRRAWHRTAAQLWKDGNPAQFTANLIFASGWREHESQQKPLKPGSAANRLSDFL